MLIPDLLMTLSGALTALSIGVMIFFGAVVAPTVFQSLPPEHSGPFMRRLFPRYYLALAVAVLLAVLAAVGALVAGGEPAAWQRLWPVPALLAAVAAGFVVSRQWLTPRINESRDGMLAGDRVAGERFERLHKASVRLNMVQLLALLAAWIWPLLP